MGHRLVCVFSWVVVMKTLNAGSAHRYKGISELVDTFCASLSRKTVLLIPEFPTQSLLPIVENSKCSYFAVAAIHNDSSWTDFNATDKASPNRIDLEKSFQLLAFDLSMSDTVSFLHQSRSIFFRMSNVICRVNFRGRFSFEDQLTLFWNASCCQTLLIQRYEDEDSDYKFKVENSRRDQSSTEPWTDVVMADEVQSVCFQCGFIRSDSVQTDTEPETVYRFYPSDAPIESLYTAFINCTPHFLVTELPIKRVNASLFDPIQSTETSMLADLRGSLNVSTDLINNKESLWGSFSMENLSWTGSVGMIFDGKVDLIVGEVSMNEERARAISYSSQFMMEHCTWLLRQPHRQSSAFAIFWPFDRSIWKHSAISLVAYSVVVQMFVIAFGLAAFTENYDFPGSSYRPNILMLFGQILKQPIANYYEYPFLSFRIIIICWWFFSFVLTNFYCSCLLSFMSLPVFAPGVDTFVALEHAVATGKVSVGVHRESFQLSILEALNTSLAKLILTQLGRNPSLYASNRREGIMRVASKPGYIFVELTSFPQGVIREERLENVLMLAKENFGQGGTAWGLQKRCFLMDRVSH